MADYRTLE
jgi:hypothetical protein